MGRLTLVDECSRLLTLDGEGASRLGASRALSGAPESQRKPRPAGGKAKKSQGGRARKAKESQPGGAPKANQSQAKPMKAKVAELQRAAPRPRTRGGPERRSFRARPVSSRIPKC